MSFSLTEEAFLDGSKTVTRRLGWKNLKPGDQVRAVRKAMGLKKGEKVHELGIIEIVDVGSRPLYDITPADVRREGFPTLSAHDFIAMFCRHMKCDPGTEVTRIEFRRLPPVTTDGRGRECCVEESVLAKLLVDEVLFVGSTASGPFFEGVDKPEHTTAVWVNCNDVFAWACADCEPVQPSELPELYRMHKAGPYGSIKWACKKRGQLPQKPLIDRMKARGAWCEVMQALEISDERKGSGSG